MTLFGVVAVPVFLMIIVMGIVVYLLLRELDIDSPEFKPKEPQQTQKKFTSRAERRRKQRQRMKEIK